MAKLTITKCWKFIRPDSTHFMLYQYKSYRITEGPHAGTTAHLKDVDERSGVAVMRTGLNEYVNVDPEHLLECT